MPSLSKISEKFYGNVLTNLKGMFVKLKHDTNSTIVYASEECLTITGYSRKEIEKNKSVTFKSLIHHDDLSVFNDFIQNLISNTEPNSAKFRIIDKTGAIKRIKCVGGGVYNKLNRLTHIEGYIQDISSTISISSVTKLFSSLQNAINTASSVSLTDSSGKIIYANEKFCLESKYSLKELIGSNHRILNSGFHSKTFFESLWNTILKGNIWRDDVCNRAKDGSIYWVDTIISPVFGKTNEIIQFLSIQNVITDRKNSEAALYKSEERFELAMAGSNDGIWDWDLLTNSVYYSPRWLDMIGYKDGELEENVNSWINLLHPEDTERVFQNLNRYLSGTINEYKAEFRLLHKNNSYVDILARGMVVKDKSGKNYRMIGTHTDITERKKTETALVKSEERLRKVFENVNDVIYTISKEGKFLTLNPAFERITGWVVAEWIGQSFIDILHPDDVELGVNVFNKVLNGWHVDTYELRIKSKSGKYIYAELTPTPLYENGEIISALGVARDISFRKETELKLKHIFETLSVKTGLNYFSTLTKFCCDNLNVKYAIIGRYLKETNTITTISFRNSEQVLENYTYSIKNLPCEKVINQERFTFLENAKELFPKNSLFYKENIEAYMGYPLLNDNNDVLGIIILMNDKPIEDSQEKENLLSFVLARTANEINRNNVEIELLRSQQRYKAVVENMNDAIIIRNIKGRIIYGNKRFLDLLGLHQGDLIELSMKDFIAPKWQGEIRKQYMKIISGASSVEVYEYEGLHNNGTTIWLEDKITLIYEDDKITGTQSIIRDITELKKKESDLNKLIHELTNRNNEMMQFNYIVSHNLRSPIANIIGLSNLINANLNHEDNKKVIEHIKYSTTKMDEMIKDLSLILNTKLTLNTKREKIYLKTIIQEITEALNDQIAESQCQLSVEIDQTTNEQFTVKSYMESILFNLISNSIKYRSSKRPLSINITAQKKEKLTVLTISDNGIGIDLQENGNHVFGLYKRFNYDVEGKGLGLHMTKAQVEALGGEISVESELNKGTTFKIEFNTE